MAMSCSVSRQEDKLNSIALFFWAMSASNFSWRYSGFDSFESETDNRNLKIELIYFLLH